MRIKYPGVFLAIAALGVGGCTNVPADRGYGDVRSQMSDRGVQLPDASADDPAELIDALLTSPLTPTSAVRVAFINNPRLQAEYARLGLGSADLVQAGLDNPTLSATWQSSSRSSDSSRYDFGLMQNFAQLLLSGARTRFSEGEFERTKLDATQRLLDFAAQVQTAYFDAVGARQVARMRATVADAARASADLAVRFKDAGNIGALALAVAQAAASQAQLDQERADADARATASVLNELLGLQPGTPWQLAGAFPALPSFDDPIDTSLRLAFVQRADLESDRREVALLEDGLGLTRSYRYFGEVLIGAQYERDTDRSKLIGPSLSLQLPIFNQGQAAVLRAESLLDAARARVRIQELEIGNRVLAATDRIAAARSRVERLANEMIPLREQIVARTQEHANFMLVGAFELLRVKQDEYAAYQQLLEAQRDYWRARVELAHAVGGVLPADLPVVSPTSGDAPPPSTPTTHHHHGETR